jgi:hypothetical protein
MPYSFEHLSAEEMVTVRDEVKKTLERTMYHEVLRLGSDPNTFDYEGLVVPDGDSTDPHVEAKKAIADAYATVKWLNTL